MYYIDGIKLKNHSEIRAHFGKKNTAMPKVLTDDLLLSLSVREIVLTEPPKGDVVAEIEAEFMDGVLTQQWTSRAYTQGERAAEMVQALQDWANGDATKFDKIKGKKVK